MKFIPVRHFIRSLGILLPALVLRPYGLHAQGGSPTGLFTWSTLAGVPGTAGSNDGGTGAKMGQPCGVCVDTDGTVYVAEFNNHIIRKITPGGVATTIAGQAGVQGTANGQGTAATFDRPSDITIDAAGTLYVADNGNHSIRKITPGGLVSLLAGSGSPNLPGSDNGIGSAARFRYPNALTIGPAGKIYVADTYNHTIRSIDPATGEVKTVAGSPGVPGFADDFSSGARFDRPAGITWNRSETLMISDYGNHVIREMDTQAFQVTLRAGVPGQAGEIDGSLTDARFNGPYGISWAGGSTYYICDFDGSTVRRLYIRAAGGVTTVGGQGGTPGPEDGTGSAARFRKPVGIAASPQGVLYVADYDNHRLSIGRVKPQSGEHHWGVLGGTSYAADPPLFTNGPLQRAEFGILAGMVFDAAGNLYVTDLSAHVIRKITPAGQVSVLAGNPGYTGSTDGKGSNASFFAPAFLAIDPAGTLFVTDAFNRTIRAVTPDGTVSTIAGTPGQQGTADGNRATARLYQPLGITILPNGNLAITDIATVRIVTRNGDVTTLAGAGGAGGYVDGTGSVARFVQTGSLVADKSGTLYVADYGGTTIRKVMSTGSVVTVAGKPEDPGVADGTGIAARFDGPVGISMGADGDFYIIEGNRTIRKMTPGGTVTTIGGAPEVFGPFGGPGTSARFGVINAILPGPDGTLYVSGQHILYRGVQPGTASSRSLAGGSRQILFAADAFSGYELQRNTSLTAASWTTLGTYTAAPNGAISHTDPSPPAARAFYRLKQTLAR